MLSSSLQKKRKKKQSKMFSSKSIQFQIFFVNPYTGNFDTINSTEMASNKIKFVFYVTIHGHEGEYF